MSSSIPQPTWFASLLTPAASPIDISARELKELMDDATSIPCKDYVVVDVRRTDLDVSLTFEKSLVWDCVIHPCAINLPAPSIRHCLSFSWLCASQYLLVVVDSLLSMLSIPNIIFHYSSSKGRGPRCGGWYQDYLDSQGPGTTTAYVLVGGVKAWKEAYPEQVKQVH